MLNIILTLKKWWPVLAVLGLVGAFLWYGHHEASEAKRLALASVESKQVEANQIVTHTKKESRHETQSMDRDALVRLLCSRQWVRNPGDCPK